MARRWKIFLIVALVSLAADQATKAWARTLPVTPSGCAIPDDIVARRCTGAAVEVIPDLWHWRLSFNTGAAFSLLHDASAARWVFTGVAFAALILLGWMVHRAQDDHRVMVAGLALIFGGCAGNLVDRVWFGVVTDFVLWHYQSHAWPVFNVADAVLLIGAVLLVIGSRPRKADAATASS